MDKKLEKKFWTVKRIIWIAGGILLGSFLVYQLVFADKRTRLNVDKEKITVSDVTQGVFDEFIVVSGVVQPIKTYHIDAIEGGYVIETLQLEEMEVLLIKKAIQKHNGNITETARELGLTRASLYRRLEKYGI